jgi:hypothetical protein
MGALERRRRACPVGVLVERTWLGLEADLVFGLVRACLLCDCGGRVEGFERIRVLAVVAGVSKMVCGGSSF